MWRAKSSRATARQGTSRGPGKPPAGAQLLVAGLCLALFVVTVWVYWGTLSSRFVNYDDDGYVAGNVHLQAELTGPSAEAAPRSHPGLAVWLPKALRRLI